MISKQDIDKIFDAARVEDVVGDYVNLKKHGGYLKGLCPFHDEKTPSFSVTPSKGIYKCFGCGKKGSAVNFLMEKESMTYPEALRSLAKRYNIEIIEEEQTPEMLEEHSIRESLLIVTSFAQKHFSENLLNTDEGKSIGLSYFRERGFRDDTIHKFQLGYGLANRTALFDAATKNGHKLEYLVKSGVTIEYKNETQNNDEPLNTQNNYADRFWARVIFPVHNLSGRVIAFGGRTLRTDKKVAKYINSPESEIYHKGDVLYGIYFAKSEIVKQDNCFLVEGYTDVISMHQAGIENVVASSGTSLTIGQIKSIRRFSKNITILYDGDSAGIKASFRGIDLILEEGMNVKVLLFPDGEDPDSYSKKVSPDELKTFIQANSTDFISFKTNLLMKDVQNDPIKKAGLIKEIVTSISLVPEAIFRSVFVKECSRIMDVEEQVLLNELNKIRRRKFDDKLTTPETKPTESIEGGGSQEDIEQQDKKAEPITTTDSQERDVIRLLLNYGNKAVIVDTDELNEKNEKVKAEVLVAQLIIHELAGDGDKIEFENKLYKTIFNEYLSLFEKEIVPEINYFIQHPDLDIAALAVDLISITYQLSDWEQHSIYVTKEEDILSKSVFHSIVSLKSTKVDGMIREIQKQIKEEFSEELIQKNMSLLKAQLAFKEFLGREFKIKSVKK